MRSDVDVAVVGGGHNGLTAAAYLAAAHDHVGRAREELDEAWKSIGAGARQRRVAAGLEKLRASRDAAPRNTTQAAVGT